MFFFGEKLGLQSDKDISEVSVLNESIKNCLIAREA